MQTRKPFTIVAVIVALLLWAAALAQAQTAVISVDQPEDGGVIVLSAASKVADGQSFMWDLPVGLPKGCARVPEKQPETLFFGSTRNHVLKGVYVFKLITAYADEDGKISIKVDSVSVRVGDDSPTVPEPPPIGPPAPTPLPKPPNLGFVSLVKNQFLMKIPNERDKAKLIAASYLEASKRIATGDRAEGETEEDTINRVLAEQKKTIREILGADVNHPGWIGFFAAIKTHMDELIDNGKLSTAAEFGLAFYEIYSGLAYWEK